MLKYALTGRFEYNVDEGPLKLDENVPAPPSSDEIDCIVTGFPWHVSPDSLIAQTDRMYSVSHIHP